jgi:succinate dehydrogenase / fumarate reductase cytochrome b subunit
MNVASAKKRPKNLNLITIRLPLPALVSILHRLSGLLLFLIIPALLLMLQTSLSSPEGFDSIVKAAHHPISKLLLIGLSWAFLHHLFAGVRHLLSDMNLGLELAQARAINKVVLTASLALTAFVGVFIW